MTDYRSAPLPPLLVVAFGSRVLGVDAATGELRWQHEIPGAAANISLVVTDTTVFAVGYVSMACYRYPSGEPLWSASTPTQGRATLMLQGDRLYIARNGELECWSVAGKLLWHDPFKGLGLGPVSMAVPGQTAQADHG